MHAEPSQRERGAVDAQLGITHGLEFGIARTLGHRGELVRALYVCRKIALREDLAEAKTGRARDLDPPVAVRTSARQAEPGREHVEIEGFLPDVDQASDESLPARVFHIVQCGVEIADRVIVVSFAVVDLADPIMGRRCCGPIPGVFEGPPVGTDRVVEPARRAVSGAQHVPEAEACCIADVVGQEL